MAGQTSSTDQMRSQIETALKNEPTLSSSNVMVNVTDTEITLSGTVATGKDKQTAKRIAQSYAGNRKVVDHITVKGMGRGANDTSNPSTSTPPPQL
jgi:osmotically-inducible protein OsmY